MIYTAVSPGSCGEFIQGYGGGASFMVTCPIDRYSVAEATLSSHPSRLPEKSERARRMTLSLLGREGTPVFVRLSSDISIGKGMASSTADISAVAQATALACGRALTPEEISKIAIAIEPSDATFYPGVVQFDYRNGKLLRHLGDLPSAQILIYDCGGEVDTLAFNARNNLVALQKENEADIARALALFEAGMAEGNLSKIGEAATISAFANQKLLYKEALPAFYEAGMAAGGLGVVAAHSGTVLGLLLPADADGEAVKCEMDRKMVGAADFLDLVHTTNEGTKAEAY